MRGNSGSGRVQLHHAGQVASGGLLIRRRAQSTQEKNARDRRPAGDARKVTTMRAQHTGHVAPAPQRAETSSAHSMQQHTCRHG
jgi:hypothetical protein